MMVRSTSHADLAIDVWRAEAAKSTEELNPPKPAENRHEEIKIADY